MDILLDLLFSFVFELLPSLFIDKETGRRPRAPEEQEAMTTGADIENGANGKTECHFELRGSGFKYALALLSPSPQVWTAASVGF